MPNWCSNAMKITGDAQNVRLLAVRIKAIEGTAQLLFEGLLPEQAKPADENQVQDFNVKTYNTKWDIPGTDLGFAQTSPTECHLNFDSAWSPPTGFCQLVAQHYGVETSLQFEEEGADFYGEQI